MLGMCNSVTKGKLQLAHYGCNRTSDPEQAKLPHWLRSKETEVITKPDHAKLAAYFNVDNGTGKIRGIYTEENASVGPIFESWIAPPSSMR